MGTSDGTVTGKSKVVNNGSDDDCWVLLVMGDGFKGNEQAQYQQAVTDFVTQLKGTAPFSTNWSNINIYRVDVESNDSGTDDTCGSFGPATSAATYFDSTVCSGGVKRAMSANSRLVFRTAKAQVPKYDDVLVIVNFPHIAYATSGNVPVAATGTGPEGMMHEGGHAWFGLADEYEYKAGCASGETTQNNYSGSEPGAPNITKVKTRSGLKWASLVKASTTLPTTPNPDCTKCDPRATSGVPVGTVGLFEGAGYFHCKLYRPEFDCKMRKLHKPFCAVCQRRMNKELKRKVSAVGATGLDDSTCFVATAVYQDASHPDVEALRRWRDQHLAGGRARPLMQVLTLLYGVVGPRAARMIAPHRTAARAVRVWLLAPLAGWIRRRPWG